jgi:lipoate-protein ligase B
MRLSRTSYQAAQALQERCSRSVDSGGDEVLLLLDLEPVFTLGRRARLEHLLLPRQDMEALGADVVETDRGGDVTFHGPGQLVGYPILNLRRRGLGAVDYVRALEETLLQTLDAFDVRGQRVASRPGVWLGQDKVAAIGVRVSRGVTTHGFALNIDLDLGWFSAIVPCGIYGAGVTSLSRALGSVVLREAVEAAYCTAFSQVFDANLTASTRASRQLVISHAD